jgi:hypothetical protein
MESSISRVCSIIADMRYGLYLFALPNLIPHHPPDSAEYYSEEPEILYFLFKFRVWDRI